MASSLADDRTKDLHVVREARYRKVYRHAAYALRRIAAESS